MMNSFISATEGDEALKKKLSAKYLFRILISRALLYIGR